MDEPEAQQAHPPAQAAPSMQSGENIVAQAATFCRKLEVDSWLQAERHITAAGFWGTFQWIVGGASAVLAAIASGTAFADFPRIAGVLALGAAGTAALVTALRPGDISAQHLQSASSFNALQVDTRDLWEFNMSADPGECRRQVHELGDRWSKITTVSPRVPRRLYRVSAKYTDAEGTNYYPKP